MISSSKEKPKRNMTGIPWRSFSALPRGRHTVNKTKFQKGLNSVDFMGHRVTPTGMKLDPEKVRAILDMEAPEDFASIWRFIGTVNYLARFLPHLSQTLQPLQNLLQKDVPFNWSSAQEEAFDHIKQKIASSPVLAFFQPDVPITLQNDASKYGLGAVLMQKDKPVAYASRSLKPAERIYAQIEKEMLAIVFGLEKVSPLHIWSGRYHGGDRSQALGSDYKQTARQGPKSSSSDAAKTATILDQS